MWAGKENATEACDLCLNDPGFEVDLYLSTTLRMMIHTCAATSRSARASTAAVARRSVPGRSDGSSAPGSTSAR
jgi:hypothetical protein